MVSIRSYQPEDFVALMELNKSLVNQWYSIDFETGNKKQSDWEELTPEERFRHGGPWNDPSTLDIHISRFLNIGHIDILELGDKIVGEVEYHLVNESVHIDWIMTHPDFRRRKMASKLIEHLANSYHNKSDILAEAEPGSEQFYIRNNFSRDKGKFVRYAIQGRDIAPENLETWKVKIPELGPHIYGEAIYDHQYLRVLLYSLLAYADVMSIENPIITKSAGEGVVLVDRKLPTLDRKHSLFVSSTHPLTNGMISDILTQYIETKPSDSTYFTTTLGKKIFNWPIANRIDQYRRSIIG